MYESILFRSKNDHLGSLLSVGSRLLFDELAPLSAHVRRVGGECRLAFLMTAVFLASSPNNSSRQRNLQQRSVPYSRHNNLFHSIPTRPILLSSLAALVASVLIKHESVVVLVLVKLV